MKFYKLLIILLLLIFITLFSINNKPQVWKQSCTGCGDCVNVCPVNAITIQNGKAIIDQDKCIDCKFCVTTCTFNAIR